MSQALLADFSFHIPPTTSAHTPGNIKEKGLWEYHGRGQTEAGVSSFKTVVYGH